MELRNLVRKRNGHVLRLKSQLKSGWYWCVVLTHVLLSCIWHYLICHVYRVLSWNNCCSDAYIIWLYYLRPCLWEQQQTFPVGQPDRWPGHNGFIPIPFLNHVSIEGIYVVNTRKAVLCKSCKVWFCNARHYCGVISLVVTEKKSGEVHCCP